MNTNIIIGGIFFVCIFIIFYKNSIQPQQQPTQTKAHYQAQVKCEKNQFFDGHNCIPCLKPAGMNDGVCIDCRKINAISINGDCVKCLSNEYPYNGKCTGCVSPLGFLNGGCSNCSMMGLTLKDGKCV
jgi:hypothetical protein